MSAAPVSALPVDDPTLALAELEREHEALLDFVYACPIGLLQLDEGGEVQIANPAASRLLIQLSAAGYTNFFAAMAAVDPELRALVDQFPATAGTICEARRIDAGRRAPNAPLPLVLSLTVIRLREGRMMAVLADVSASAEQERAARRAEQRLRTFLDGAREYAMLHVTGTGELQGWNQGAERLFGFDGAERVGRSLATLLADSPAISPASLAGTSDERFARRVATMLEGARAAGWVEDEGWWVRKATTCFYGGVVITAIPGESGAVEGFTVLVRDLSRRYEIEDELRRRAATDFLTGVANRAHFAEVAESELARAQRLGAPLSVILFDADRFKQTNDTHGHAAGDEVLRAIAHAAVESVRTVDLVARHGGEEFVVLLPSTDTAGARATAERVRLAIERLVVRVGDASIRTSVSAGVATTGAEATTLAALVADADRALYEAKRRGRNQVVVAGV